MVKRLISARAKLDRANEHLDSFHSAYDDFLRDEPYSITQEVDATRTEHVFRFHVVREPPLTLSTIAGDAVQNMRAALDHIVFELAHHEAVYGLSNEEAEKLQFPICDSPASFQRQVERGRLRGIHDWTFIEAVQPYPGKDWRLGVLRDLSNIDKHRSLHFLVTSLTQAITDIDGEDILAETSGCRAGSYRRR